MVWIRIRQNDFYLLFLAMYFVFAFFLHMSFLFCNVTKILNFIFENIFFIKRYPVMFYICIEILIYEFIFFFMY